MDKQAILQLVLAQLEKDLEVARGASQAAYEAATHEENKAEDQYDTRGIEASYLASAQAQRVSELEKSISSLKNLNLRGGSTIKPGALVELEQEGRELFVFFLPFGAGLNISYQGKSISVVTPASPLGQELLDRQEGDNFRLTAKGSAKEYDIVKVF